jgi:mono/diheme cytochrome c family protein
VNYPIWQLSASGLLIAVVAILHVFVSHFAVGGGLFLVLTERKARRDGDSALLDYVRRHSRFFVLLTLVFGAVSGVGIWFTIGLVHPAATAALINAFVWGWAIEWTFFLTEIVAALVYVYGWDRLTARQHVAVGWVYFIAAYASLAIINGILTFMLTPGRWLETRAFWDGFFNPTYWPALAVRTLGAVALAGIYALMTSAWLASPPLQRTLTRYATLRWIVPAAIAFPFALAWFLAAAASAGVPVSEIFGGSILSGLGQLKPSGQPMAQRAFAVAVIATCATALLALATLAIRRRPLLRIVTALAMLAALFSIGGAEWVREDLRKPYVIGSYMLVDGVTLPPPAAARHVLDDPYRIDLVSRSGVLAASHWSPATQKEAERGKEVFRLLCSQCHTVDGYLAIRPLVSRKSSVALERTIDQLATWRGRRMPPFAGTEEEEHALAVYLATLGGGAIVPATTGGEAFEKYCSACHGEGGIPLNVRVGGKSEPEIYALIGRLPALNPAMPPFDGTDAERHALAAQLARLRR